MTPGPLANGRDRRARERVAAPRLLLADDSSAIRRLFRASLEAVGYEVAEAADGADALAACRRRQPDLVLLDVDMPLMDGLEVLAGMRADAALCGVPVLFLAARATAAAVVEALESAGHDFVRKPCDPGELVARVAASLSRAAEELAAGAPGARTDPLTGLGDRRLLERRAVELLDRLDGRAPAGVVALEVDRLGAMLGTGGQVVWDVVVRIVASRLVGVLDARHTLIRSGDGEFLVLAPRLAGPGLDSLCARLQETVAGSPFAIRPGMVLRVTAGVGCASGRLDDLDHVVEAARAALTAQPASSVVAVPAGG